MAEAAARTAHSDLYFLHKEKLEWLREHTEPQDLQRLRKLVQGATKPLVQTFDRAANKAAAAEYASLRKGVLAHAMELLNLLLRVGGLCAERLGAIKELDSTANPPPGAGMEALLALRRRAFEMKALGKKHKKALRAEKRVYLKAVTTYLPGTPAMLDLQNEVSAPLLERVKASLAATLNDGGNSAGSGGILGALNETRDRARVDFGRASREWGIAFDRTSMEGFVAALSDVVTKAEQQFQPSASSGGKNIVVSELEQLQRAMAEDSVTANALRRAQAYDARRQRLVVDNDVLLYQIAPPQPHPDPEWRAVRCQIETGHFMAIYSGVTLPEERTGGPAHHTLRGSSSSGGTRGRGRGESEGAPGRNSEAADKAAKLLASQKAFKAHAFTARRAEAFKAEAMKEVQKTGDEHRHYQQDSWLALRHKDADPVYAGKRVVLKSVRGRQDLEGQIGDAVSFDEVSGRYLVQLDDGRRVKLFPSKLCGHCADPRDGPCQVCKLLRGD